MHSCPICYQRSKRQGARPLRRSLARIAAARLIEARDEIAVLLDCPFSGRLVRDFTVRAAHAANHLANSSPTRFSVMLEEDKTMRQEYEPIGGSQMVPKPEKDVETIHYAKPD